MNRARYLLSEEPEGLAYARLLQGAPDTCDAFQLVVRPSLPLEDAGLRVLADLDQFLVHEEDTSEWPGTWLWSGTARLRRYRLTRQAVAVLAGAAGRLYQWQQPELPEDLCLLRPGGDVWLATVAHEAFGYMQLHPDEVPALAAAVPGLVLEADDR